MSELTREELQILLDMQDNAELSRWHSIRLDRLKAIVHMALAGLAVQKDIANRIKALEDDGKQRTALGNLLLAELKALASLPEVK